MEVMILGLLIWSLVHFVPSIGQPVKTALIGKLGDNGYKLAFTIAVLLGLALIVYGWRHSAPSLVYTLPATSRHLAFTLILVAFVLFGASKYPTRIKRLVRHPQLSGVMLWAIAHLMLNGDSRSLLLFGWLGVWALLEMIFISRREGVWVKPDAPGWGRELRGLAISMAILITVVFAHPYIAGVAIR